MATNLITADDMPLRLADAGDSVPLLTVAHHEDPGYIGRAVPLVPGLDLVIGRQHDVFDGALGDSKVSRQHARVMWTRGSPEIEDSDSHNGTYVNGVRVRRAGLLIGDTVRLGRTLLYVQRGPMGYVPPEHQHMVGRSYSLARLLARLHEAARSRMPALLVGETGSGKELAARALHDESGAAGRFVAVSCTELSDGLVQSELFGHVKGSFTGAGRNHEGLVAAARRGTLFLDELGAASPVVQSNLLRVIELGTYRAVGSDQTRSGDVRYVAACQPGIQRLVHEQRFRDDLLMRFEACRIEVPALRDRTGDIPLLARSFAEKAAGGERHLSVELAALLMSHPWPGNIRELRSVMDWLVQTEPDSATLHVSDRLELELAQRLERWRAPTQPMELAPEDGKAGPFGRPDEQALLDVLRDLNGNVRRTAARFGVDRRTVYRWTGDYGIDLSDVRADPETPPKGEPC